MLPGWLILGGLAAATGVALWRLGLPRLLASLTGAAMMLGAAGYSLQGRPGLSGAPVELRRERREIDSDRVSMRLLLFGRFGSTAQYFVAADALERSGSPGSAVRLLLGALRGDPRNPALWSGLGLAIQQNDGGAMSPPARFAFDQALRVQPTAPGAFYFYGLAWIIAGEPQRARDAWRAALVRTAPGSPQRRAIAERLTALDEMLAMGMR